MLPIRKTPKAYQDLAEIALYIGDDNPEAALRFLDAAEETFELLSRWPYIGARLADVSEEVEDFRVRTVIHFSSYLVYYRPEEDCVLIARVVHGARE